jgi:hypothetical protein
MDFDQTYADYLDDTAVSEIEALEQETGKLIKALNRFESTQFTAAPFRAPG